MRFEIACLLLLAVAAFAQSPAAGSGKADKNDAKFLVSGLTFTTFTIAKTTTTTTSIFTSTVTCTTSTATLSTCSAGRRRRGLFYSEGEASNRRGLFYNDEELPHPKDIFKRQSNNPVDEVKPKTDKKPTAEEVIPLEIQAGFNLPKDTPANRFLLAFGTSTVTTFSITTSTTSLTAICSSTTGYPTCSSGK